MLIATAPEWLVGLVATASPDGAIILEVGELADKIAQMITDGWVEMKTSYGRRQFRRPPYPAKNGPPIMLVPTCTQPTSRGPKGV